MQKPPSGGFCIWRTGAI